MVFIYWIEGNPKFVDRVDEIYRRIRDRGDTLCTSVFTLGELLVGPRLKNNQIVETQIRRMLTGSEVELLPINETTMLHYAQIRATTGASSADAIHLASASQAEVDLFITNDSRLRNFIVPGINFLAGIDGSVL